MTPQELNAIKALTKSIDGLTKAVNNKHTVHEVIYADNIPYLSPLSPVTMNKNNEGTLQNVRDILTDFGLSQSTVAGIIRSLEDSGVVFHEVDKSSELKT